jgi:hypothetical protein
MAQLASEMMSQREKTTVRTTSHATAPRMVTGNGLDTVGDGGGLGIGTLVTTVVTAVPWYTDVYEPLLPVQLGELVHVDTVTGALTLKTLPGNG